MWRKADARQFGQDTMTPTRTRRLFCHDVERIHKLADNGCNPKEIAERLGVHPSSVSYRLKSRQRNARRTVTCATCGAEKKHEHAACPGACKQCGGHDQHSVGCPVVVG